MSVFFQKRIQILFKAAFVLVVAISFACLNFAVGGILFERNIAQASFNPQINYQGKLTDSSGIAVGDDDYRMYFRLYTVATGGSDIWEEDRSTDAGDQITVTNGLFSVMLGSSTPLTGVDFDQVLYLGVEICGPGGSAEDCDGEMTPRKILGAVPAAFEAENANTLDDLSSEQFLRSDAPNATSTSNNWLSFTQSGAGRIADFVGQNSRTALSLLSTGNVGVGTTSPFAKLSVHAYNGETGALFAVASSTGSATTTHFVIASGGNVGIGTAAPSFKFDVTGAGRFTSDITTGGDVRITNNNQITFDNGQDEFAFILNDANNTYGFGSGELVFASYNGFRFMSGETFDPIVEFSGGGQVSATNFTAISSTGVSSLGRLLVNSSTTLQNFTFNKATGTAATTTSLAISSLNCTGFTNSGKLTTNSSGSVICADDVSGSGGGSSHWATSTLDSTSIHTAGATNVGIGTTSPYAKLSVHALNGETNSSLFAIASSTGSATTTQFVVTNAGRVGIGIAEPSRRFEVWGANTASGNPVTAVIGGTFDGVWSNEAIATQLLFESSDSTGGAGIRGAIKSYVDDTTGADFGLSFFTTTNGATGLAGLGERMRINHAGNVGIGTTDPSTILEIAGDLSFTGGANRNIFIENPTQGTNYDLIIKSTDTFEIAPGDIYITGGSDSGATFPGADIFIYPGGTTGISGNIIMALNGTTPVGNVGIGTSSPYSKLSVVGQVVAANFVATSTTAISSFQQLLVNSSTTLQNFTFRNATGTAATTTSLAISSLDCTGFTNSGKLTTTSAGSVICADDTSGSGGTSLWATSTAVSTSIHTAGATNVGIGTTSPSARLSVTGSGTGTGRAFAVADSNNSEKLIVLDNGKVGIGRTPISSDGSLLQISSDTLASASLYTASDSASFGSLFSGRRSRGTNASPSAVQQDDALLNLIAAGYGGFANINSASIRMSVDGTVDTVTVPGRITFHTSTAAELSERMRITSAGLVGIGTSTPYAKLSVHGLNDDTTPWLFAVARSSASATTTHFVVTSTGNVAVGTSSPYAKLTAWGAETSGGKIAEIVTSASTTLLSAYNSNLIEIGADQAGNILFETSATGQVTLIGIGTTTPDADVTIVSNQTTSNTYLFTIGTSTGGGQNRRFIVDTEGDVFHDGSVTQGADYAEAFPVVNSKTLYEPGDIVSLSKDHPGKVEKSDTPYDEAIAGVYSTKPGTIGTLADDITEYRIEEENDIPVGIMGRIPTKVSVENGPIKVGDYITSSTQPGIGMRATSSGRVIGRALESYNQPGVGKIMVFVQNTYNVREDLFAGIATSTTILMSSEEDGSVEGTTLSAIIDYLESVGLKFMDSIAYIKNLVVEKLTVGSPEKPTGITLYDEVTGEPYCLSVRNGRMVSKAGECDVRSLPTESPVESPNNDGKPIENVPPPVEEVVNEGEPPPDESTETDDNVPEVEDLTEENPEIPPEGSEPEDNEVELPTEGNDKGESGDSANADDADEGNEPDPETPADETGGDFSNSES